MSSTQFFFNKLDYSVSQLIGGKELQTENLGKENVGSGHKHRVMTDSLMEEEESLSEKGRITAS